MVSEEEKKKRKKIYPSHSGNFCDSVISGDRGIKRFDERDEKRERETTKKEKKNRIVCLSTL